MPADRWIDQLGELNDAIASTARTNVQTIGCLRGEVSSKAMMRQLISSEVHALLVGRVGMALIQDCIPHTIKKTQQHSGGLSEELAKLEAQAIVFITERLRTMSKLTALSGIDELRSLASLLFENIIDLIPGAETLKLMWGLRDLLDAINAAQSSVNEVDKGLLKWETFDFLAFEIAVWTTLEVEAFTTASDEASLMIPIDELAGRAMAKAVKRVEGIFQGIRSGYPEEIWAPSTHGGSLLSEALASDPI